MFYSFSYRGSIVLFLTQSLIYFIANSPNLEEWLQNEGILSKVEEVVETTCAHAEVFRADIDPDFDPQRMGVSWFKFAEKYEEWLLFCLHEHGKSESNDSTLYKETMKKGTQDNKILKLCYLMSLLGRRAILYSSASSSYPIHSYMSFLAGFNAIFEGDIRIMSTEDEWIYAELSLLELITKASRISLKLHTDNIAFPNEYDDSATLHDAICDAVNDLIICPETDEIWQQAILENRPTLMSLRRTVDENSSDSILHHIVMLTLRYAKFRVIKVNSESVRSMWAAQQQEQIFFGNTNTERGSIQQMKSTIRNLITQSCDLPIGYPIYISPITRSVSQELYEPTDRKSVV